MGIEIERKFLVDGAEYSDDAETVITIIQGYLNIDIDRTVRVRVNEGLTSQLTVKGRNAGCIRSEYEYDIPVKDGMNMLQMCSNVITKKRHYIHHDDLTVEVDEFIGDNNGLVVAEIEFANDDNRYLLPESELKKMLPEWIGKEVTDEPKYYNSSLILRPYTEW